MARLGRGQPFAPKVTRFGVASSAQSLSAGSAIATWVVSAAVITAGAVSLSAGSAVATWTVPAVSFTGAQSLAADTPASTWTVPSVTVSMTMPVGSAVSTWIVPAVSFPAGGITPSFTNDLTTALVLRLAELRNTATVPPTLDSTGLLVVDLKAARDAAGAQLKDQNTDIAEYLN